MNIPSSAGFRFSDTISIQLRKKSNSYRKPILLLCNALGFFGTIYTVLSMFSPVCWNEGVLLFSICSFLAASFLTLLPGRLHMLIHIIPAADLIIGWIQWERFLDGAKFFYNQFYSVIHHTDLEYFRMESYANQASSITFFLCCCIAAFAVLISRVSLRSPNIFFAFAVTFPMIEAGLYNGIEAHPVPIAAAVIYWFFILGVQIADYRHYQGQYSLGFIRKNNLFSAQHVLRRKVSGLCGAILACITALAFLFCNLLIQHSNLLNSDSLEKTRSNLHQSLNEFNFNQLSESFSSIQNALRIGNSLSYKKLNRVGNIEYDNKTDLVITVDQLPSNIVYLKGSTASVYDDNSWDVLPDTTYADYEELNNLMQNYGCVPQISFYQFSTEIFQKQAPYQMTIHAKNRENTCFLPYGFYNESITSLFDYGSKTDSNRSYTVSVLEPDSYQSLTEYSLDSFALSLSMFHTNDEATNAFLGYLGIPEDVDAVTCDSYFDPTAIRSNQAASIIQNLLAESNVYRPFVQEVYTETPNSEEVKEVYRSLQAQIPIQPLSDDASLDEQYAALDAIQTAVSNLADYTLSPGEIPRNRDFIQYFLEENHKGYCVHFATAGTVLARYWNIPTRYCEGYVIAPDDIQSATQNPNGSYTIRLTDARAHAWCEFYVSGYGWIPYEFTPGYVSGNLPAKETTVTTAVATTTTVARQSTAPRRSHTTLQQEPHTTSTIQTTISQSPVSTASVQTEQRSNTVIPLTVLILIILILLIGLPIFIHRYRYRRCRQILYGRNRTQSVLTAYDKFIQLCRLIDCTPGTASAVDFAAIAADVLSAYDIDAAEPAALIEIAQAAQFNCAPPTSKQQQQAVKALECIADKLYTKSNPFKRLQIKFRTHLIK